MIAINSNGKKLDHVRSFMYLGLLLLLLLFFQYPQEEQAGIVTCWYRPQLGKSRKED